RVGRRKVRLRVGAVLKEVRATTSIHRHHGQEEGAALSTPHGEGPSARCPGAAGRTERDPRSRYRQCRGELRHRVAGERVAGGRGEDKLSSIEVVAGGFSGSSSSKQAAGEKDTGRVRSRRDEAGSGRLTTRRSPERHR